MVRSVKNNHNHNHNQEEEEEEDDEDFISRTTDGSSHKDHRRDDQKVSSHRSKHSETEQRRRSKINERFQILRELIPENDQKRDRASFLLEVVQYIQFLQEKLQVYEGAYQGWNSEPTNLMPWRGNCGEDQSQPIKNGFVGDDHGDATLHQTTYESEPSHTPQGSFPDVELTGSQSQPQTWNGMVLSSEGPNQNELEESSISDAYSMGLLNSLTQALGSSGVNLSQASISVQLDIRKGTQSGATSTSFGIKDDHNFLPPSNQATTHCGVTGGDNFNIPARKRPRTEQNQ